MSSSCWLSFSWARQCILIRLFSEFVPLEFGRFPGLECIFASRSMPATTRTPSTCANTKKRAGQICLSAGGGRRRNRQSWGGGGAQGPPPPLLFKMTMAAHLHCAVFCGPTAPPPGLSDRRKGEGGEINTIYNQNAHFTPVLQPETALYERLPKLCFLKPVLRWTRVVANISKPWKAIWAPPKAITLVTTFQPVLLDVVPQSHSMQSDMGPT